MGTRSLTFVREKGKNKNNKVTYTKIICMYRQFDGYPSGHGQELADFLKSRKLVNGMGGEARTSIFNGPNCLAAVLVSDFKGKEAGGIYLHPVGTKDAGQDFTYYVDVDMDTYTIELTCKTSSGKILFKGDPKLFDSEVLKSSY
jgi:hypothetical protein